MKPGVSTLNPYAASYIPLAKRDGGTNKKHFSGAGGWSGTSDHSAQSKQPYRACSVPDVSLTESQSVLGYYGSSSQSPIWITQKQMIGEEDEEDLDYLRMTFPGISDESLNDVYLVNKGDLDATVDMLNQLEYGPTESSEILPDSLDIGDVSESVTLAGYSSAKLKNAVGEASTSSSVSTSADSINVT